MEHRDDILMLWVLLTPASRAELLRRFGCTHTGRKLAEHMTVAFKPTPEEITAFTPGEEVKLTVVGYGADDKGQAVVVEGFGSRNAIPHITISVAEGTKPVYSNTMLANGFVELERPFTLVGHTVAVTKRQERIGGPAT